METTWGMISEVDLQPICACNYHVHVHTHICTHVNTQFFLIHHDQLLPSWLSNYHHLLKLEKKRFSCFREVQPELPTAFQSLMFSTSLSSHSHLSSTTSLHWVHCPYLPQHISSGRPWICGRKEILKQSDHTLHSSEGEEEGSVWEETALRVGEGGAHQAKTRCFQKSLALALSKLRYEPLL